MTIPFPPSGYVEASLKRVRVFFGGQWIVDTKVAKLGWEHPNYPQYFFPPSEVPEKYLEKSSQDTYDVVVDSKRAAQAAVVFKSGPFSGLLKIVFGKMDAWFEEEEQIFIHPKDPYKRVEVLPSSRHIRVEVDGVEVANTKRARLLFETGLPVRSYIPKTDTRLDILEPSTLTTQCPYKGVASYYNVKLPSGQTRDDIVWWYRTPLLECSDIRGHVAFYDEKVDVWVDGVKVEPPKTHFA